MADRSAIEWTDATWNPLRGCSRVSAGCQHCYAERVAARFSGPGMPYEGLIHPTTRGWNGQVRLVPEVLDQPLRWRRPRRVFVNSMSDLFHEKVPDSYIAAVFGIMAACPQHIFQVLTKRPERAAVWFGGPMRNSPRSVMHEGVKGAMGYDHPSRPAINDGPWPLPNVWLGVSVENQAAADERIPRLLEAPVAVRWLSCEPLLAPVDLTSVAWPGLPGHRVDVLRGGYWNKAGTLALGPAADLGEPRGGFTNHSDMPGTIDWVVAGGESGVGARPIHPDWARSLRDQCAATGVPFFFKQWGEWAPHLAAAGGDMGGDMRAGRVRFLQGDGREPDGRFRPGDAAVERVGKRAAGRLLDGREHNEFPEVAEA